MICDAKGTGETVEEAVAAAIAALNAPESAEVKTEILTFPEKKVFGLFGGKSAEARAYYEIPDAPAVKKTKATPVAKKVKPVAAAAAPAAKKEPVKVPAPKKMPLTEEAPVKEDLPVAPAAPAQKPVPTPVALTDCPETVQKAYDYLKTVVEGVGLKNAEISLSKTEKEYFFTIQSEDDYALLIGRRGETLDAIQYLVRLAANHGKEEGAFAKISVNVGNYRQKRESTLKEIAKKNGKRVRKYGRNVTLDPMNPFERRIIHTAIAEMEGLQSYSVGSDADRRVVIALAEGVKPLQQRNGGGRYNNNRNRGGRNGGYNRDRKPREAAPAAPCRAPRADAEGVRYGKIMPKAAAEAENKED